MGWIHRFLLRRLLAPAALIALAPWAAAGAEMSFRTVRLESAHCGARCAVVIAAEGEIVETTPEAFRNFLHAHAGAGNLRSVVLIDSPGGKVIASMEFGRLLRRLGMAVIVARPTERANELAPGRCYSACVYALMGGRKRVIPPESQVGVHRMFNYETSFDLFEGGLVRERNYDDGGMLDLLARYSALMGVSKELVVLAERTSADRLHMLSGAEIARWRLGARRM
jgi:hypothetical protein